MIFGVEIELGCKEPSDIFLTKLPERRREKTPRNLISYEKIRGVKERRERECSKINRAHERNFQKGGK